MHNLRTYILVLLNLYFVLAMQAQKGQCFWFAAPEMALHSRDMQLCLCLFADSTDADVRLSMPAVSDESMLDIHLVRGQDERILLAENYTDYMGHIAVRHNRVMPRAIQIESTAPITCYVQMTGVNGEIYTLKGENALGRDFSLAMQNRFRNSNLTTKHHVYDDAYASAQIVATEDNTEVMIAPTQVLWGDSAVTQRQIRLNKGEVYSFRAASKQALAHLTATRIHATRPIAVFTMDDSMSPYQKYMGEDAVADQQVPVSLCGQDYIAIGNGLKWEGVFVTNLENDSTEYMPMYGHRSLYIHRDYPIQVFQLTGMGNEAGGTQLPSLEHSGSRYVRYVRPQDSRWTIVRILTRTNNIGHIRVNQQVVDASLFEPVQDAVQWSFAQIDMSTYSTNEPIEVRSTGDVFHLSVIDASSNSMNQRGIPVPTSCSFAYFSSYSGAIHQEREVAVPVAPKEEIKDTLTIAADTITEQVKDSNQVEKKSRPHRLNLYMQGAYSHIPFGNADFQWGMGYGAGLGLNYEYQHEHLLLNIGVGFLWQDVEHRWQADQTYSYTDTQGTESTINMRIKRSDRCSMAYVEMPVLVGGMWRWLYLLGGVKTGVLVYGSTRSEARVTNCAEYDRYFVPISNAAIHGLQTDVPTVRTESRPSVNVDTRLSIEAGWHWQRYRLGLYVDYGVLWPKMDNGVTPYLQINDWANLTTWEMHHPLHASVANTHYAHNFFAGMKFTIQLIR